MHTTRIISACLLASGLVAADNADGVAKGIPVASLITADSDQDGALSKDEWREAIRHHMHEIRDQAGGGVSLEKLNAADRDGDGRLSREELQAAMQAGRGDKRGHGRGKGQDKGENRGQGHVRAIGKAWEQSPIPLSVIVGFDTDQDGFLVREEVRAGMQAHFGIQDEPGHGAGKDDQQQRKPSHAKQGVSMKELQAADRNGDGRLDREELQQVLRQDDR